MKKVVTMFLPLAFGAVLAACGSSPPPPPEPVVVQAAPCAEQWVHMPMLLDFPTGGSELDYQNRQILDELVRSAQARNDIRRVRVEGHTDTCGNELDNRALSESRATSVASELVRMGVPRNLISTIGYGSSQPRANESCGRHQRLSEQTNRRVEFSLLVCR
jgi:outer membrane protein OmpA-like peptidoglycan-associated protein